MLFCKVIEVFSRNLLDDKDVLIGEGGNFIDRKVSENYLV